MQTDDGAEAGETTKEEKKEKPKKKKNLVKTIDLPVMLNVPQLMQQQLDLLFEKEVSRVVIGVMSSLLYVALFANTCNRKHSVLFHINTVVHSLGAVCAWVRLIFKCAVFIFCIKILDILGLLWAIF